MPVGINIREQQALASYCVKWCALGAWVGLVAGSASAGFLASLEWATGTRLDNPWLLWLLPVGGIATGIVYSTVGKSVEGGSNLLLDKVHNPDSGIPFRMAPLILLSTVVTHLFGGSAGREGTAVQMGGTLANMALGPLKLSKADHRIVIMAGIAAGFGSVFGTPIAGMIFGMEVLAVGRIEYDGLLPCLVASFVGDFVCRGLGIHHHAYTVGQVPTLSPQLIAWVVVAGVLFSLASMMFTEFTAWTHAMAKRIPFAWARPGVGGVIVIALVLVFGPSYLGLSIPLIDQSFRSQDMALWIFAVKILFTAVTLGFGFKGGEVTPLFCIGATLGAAFGASIHQPPALFAALGFVSVFAGAANTPLACVAMGIELFGSQFAVPLTIACVVSYILSGHRGIYLSQRVAMPKANSVLVAETSTLRDTKAGALEVMPASSLGLASLFAWKTPTPGGNLTLASDIEISVAPYGMLRIFIRNGERKIGKTLRERLLSRPLYHEIIQAAKEYGVTHGVVRGCMAGFAQDHRIAADNSETMPSHLPLYIELHGTRESLEGFCKHRRDLLEGKPLFYKEIEYWGWSEASPPTLDEDRDLDDFASVP